MYGTLACCGYLIIASVCCGNSSPAWTRRNTRERRRKASVVGDPFQDNGDAKGEMGLYL